MKFDGIYSRISLKSSHKDHGGHEDLKIFNHEPHIHLRVLCDLSASVRNSSVIVETLNY